MDAITSMSMFKETIKSFFVKWLSTFWNRILFQLMRETPWCDKFKHILTLLKLILKIYYAFKSKYIMEQKIYVLLFYSNIYNRRLRNFGPLLRNYIKTNDICVRVSGRKYIWNGCIIENFFVVLFYPRTKRRNDMPCTNILFWRKIDIDIGRVFYIYDFLYICRCV